MTHSNDTDDYLWEPTAPVDAEIARLERALARYRFDPDRVPIRRHLLLARKRRWGVLVGAVAAGLAVVVLGTAGYRWSWPQGHAWPMTMTGADNAVRALVPGESLRLGQGEQARIAVARIGVLEALSGADLMLRATASNNHRLALAGGVVRVRVWAPPSSVSITTPAGEVVDLGCAFRLSVSPDGLTSVAVESGWVLLSNVAGESLVPAGASSQMSPGLPPLVPVFDDATPSFRRGSRLLEQAMLALPTAETSLDFLADARTKDVLTLLWLAKEASSDARLALVERAAQLVPPPSGVTIRVVAQGNREQLWQWVDALDLPAAKSWWLNWRDAFAD
jgi:hypothetical protein